MALTADEWHILAICLFPVISALGITASIFVSSANNRTVLAMGVIFSAGVLLSASLVHMLPHASEVLDEHFAAQDSHDDHGDEDDHADHDDHESELLNFEDNHDDHDDHADEDVHAGHDHDLFPHDDTEAPTDNHDDHSGHDHLRLMRFLEEDDHDDHAGEDGHAGHNHAFPWAQTIFSMAFIFLLCIEATMERFIDIYFAGRKGNFFHGGTEEEEEMMYAQGYAAEHERLLKERVEREKEGNNAVLDQSRKSGISSVMQSVQEDGEEHNHAKDIDDIVPVKDENESAQQPDPTNESEVVLHDYCCDEHHKPGAIGSCASNDGHANGHGHNHDHAAEEQAANGHGHSHDHATEEQAVEQPKEAATKTTVTTNGAVVKDTSATEELSTETAEKEDTQPVAKPPGPMINIPFPDCKECQISYKMPLADCKDCAILSKEDLGYDDPDLAHRHHHHNNLHASGNKVTLKRAGSQDGGSEMGASGTGSGLPGDLRWRAPRRNSGTSNISGKSSAWGKSAPRPSVVSYGVSAPIDEPEQQQTINPWVAILLTVVLSIHVILEGLTIGSSSDVETIRKTFVAVAVHKIFAAFSLGSSLVASGYWESNRTMFFVLAGVFIAVDVISLAIGMGIGNSFEQNAHIVGAVFQSLLGGSFLFVATVELIPGEMEKMRKHNLPLLPILLSLCVGFAAMTILSKWGV